MFDISMFVGNGICHAFFIIYGVAFGPSKTIIAAKKVH
jgi:hypothetical protein